VGGNTGEITQLLVAARHDAAAADALSKRVHKTLLDIAEARLRNERRQVTLQAGDLVSEAWIRLTGNDQIDWRDRGQFFAAAAGSMRRILVDEARRRARRLAREAKRDHRPPCFGSMADLADLKKPEEVLALERALRRLEEERPRAARVVHFRFFAGLSEEDTATSLGVSRRTVQFDWEFARAWLYRKLVADDDPDEEFGDAE